MKDLEIKIESTKDYSIFGKILGNRQVRPGHLANLASSILTTNLLVARPIIVNEKMDIVDGQHRLEVARNNNLTIYYIKLPDADLSTVQILNSNNANWTAYDFITSYAEQGKMEYKLLKELIDDKHLTSSNAMWILNRKSGYSNRGIAFKTGNFKIDNLKEAEKLIDAYVSIRPYVMLRAWNDREFVYALVKLLEKISIDSFIVKLQNSTMQIDIMARTRDYLRYFEDIIRFGTRSSFRLNA